MPLIDLAKKTRVKTVWETQGSQYFKFLHLSWQSERWNPPQTNTGEQRQSSRTETCRLSCCCPRCRPGSPALQPSAAAPPDCFAAEARWSGWQKANKQNVHLRPDRDRYTRIWFTSNILCLTLRWILISLVIWEDQCQPRVCSHWSYTQSSKVHQSVSLNNHSCLFDPRRNTIRTISVQVYLWSFQKSIICLCTINKQDLTCLIMYWCSHLIHRYTLLWCRINRFTSSLVSAAIRMWSNTVLFLRFK